MFEYDEENNITQVGFKDFFLSQSQKVNSCVFKYLLTVQIIYDNWHIYFYDQI